MHLLFPEEGGKEAKYFFTGRSRVSRTFRLKGRKPDGEHLHLLIQESTFVLVGEIEFRTTGEWQELPALHGVTFDIKEPHDVRIREDSTTISYPHAPEDLVAVTSTEKIVPPTLDIFDDEIELVLREDRFDSPYLSDPSNKEFWSNGLREDTLKSRLFMDIVERNRKKLSTLRRVLEP